MVLDYVKSCEACQKSKRSQTIHKAPLKNMPIAEKFGRRHIDFLGPLTEAEDGSKYILLVVDSLISGLKHSQQKQLILRLLQTYFTGRFSLVMEHLKY